MKINMIALNQPVVLDKKYLLASAGALLACGAGGLAASTLIMKGPSDETKTEKTERITRITLIGFTIGFFLAVIINVLPHIMNKSKKAVEVAKKKIDEVKPAASIKATPSAPPAPPATRL
jgi:hypothetical protein